MSSVHTTQTLKFLYSYNGKIVPRRPDGKLRYIGGFTRVLAVDRSVTFSELMVKFGESCGISMSLKCKLPTEDLDVLVTICNDEDLKSLIEEYDRVSALRNEDMKIRAILYPVKLQKKKILSPPSSPVSCFDFPALNVKPGKVSRFNPPPSYVAVHRCPVAALGYPAGRRIDNERLFYPYGHGRVRPLYYYVPHHYH